MNRPHSLTCEYLVNPIGIDASRPRLSWKSGDARAGARQTAYQIKDDTGWDTGRVKGDDSLHIPYGGAVLRSRQQVTWRVRTWDAAGKPSAWSQPAFFEMGLLDAQEWQAQWIGSPVVGGSRTTSPCPHMRTEFKLPGEVKRARLYVTALGVYQLHINGERVGRDEFRPGWTDYRTRVQYDTYNVTEALRKGRNAVGAILGDGWYCGHIAADNRQNYGDRPRLLAQLVIELKDGGCLVVKTDRNWKTASGPILEADFIMGEAYDARLELKGWNQPGYQDHAWASVVEFPDNGAKRVASMGVPVRAVCELKPIAKPVAAKYPGWGWHGWVFDLGQNMVGRIRLKVKCGAGVTLRLRHAETVNGEGNLYTENLRSARATDYFTTAKDGVSTWEPAFTFHGFRYVEVCYHAAFDSTGRDAVAVTPGMVTGVVLHSDMPRSGTFSCSNPLINQLQSNIEWGQRGNYLEVPTDCPQRDERLGWTGDAQVFAKTGAFNFNTARFFGKWQQDLEDAQNADGRIPIVIPNHTNAPSESPAWSDAVIICPWVIYRSFGDAGILRRHFDSMARFMGFLERESAGYIRRHTERDDWGGFGDWLALDGSGRTDGGTPKDLIATAYFAYDSMLMANIARILGKAPEARHYEVLWMKIRKAFLKRFVNAEGFVGNGSQTCYALALKFDLLPESLRKRAAYELARDVRRRGDKLSTGFVGTSYLPYALSDHGYPDMAYKLLLQQEWPSWLYAVTQGATTIWERWDGWTKDKGFQNAGMNSFNHYAYGAIGEWLYSRVAGIDMDPDVAAYKRIVFRPTPGGGITRAQAELETLYGQVSSSWRLTGSRFILEIRVPPNTSGTVALPGEKKVREVSAGAHRFSVPWRASAAQAR